jgi:signal peptidase I
MAVSARDPEPVPVTEHGVGRHARGGLTQSRTWTALREVAIVLVLALALSAFVRAVLVQAFYVPSASMEETLLPSDRILASKINTRLGGVNRGEVVVFKDPGDWLPEPPPPPEGFRGNVQQALIFIGLLPSDSGKDLVKRVIGIGGDRVACCDADGQIVLNAVGLAEDYIVGPTDQVRFDVVVPPDSIFVMGDNRGDSRDSRYYLDEANGSVPIANVVGRTILILWPFDRLSTLPIPGIFGEPALNE